MNGWPETRRRSAELRVIPFPASKECWPAMKTSSLAVFLGFLVAVNSSARAEPKIVFSGEKHLNHLVTVLLEVTDVSQAGGSFKFIRAREGYVLAVVETRGTGDVTLKLDGGAEPLATITSTTDTVARHEVVRMVAAGEHKLSVETQGAARIDKVLVKAIPELIHCGLGFNPAIKSYGNYDLPFLEKDILPNVTTLIVPSGIKLEQAFIDDWHRQGKKFVAGTGINYQARTADEHFEYWTGFLEKAPFPDGIIIDEFIVNNPIREWMPVISPDRQKKFDEERAQYPLYEEAFRKIRADERFRDKVIYAYVGGSGKELNQEIIGPNFIHTILDCGFRIGLERYIFEVSSEEKSKNVQRLGGSPLLFVYRLMHN